jgi:transmembrane sensor
MIVDNRITYLLEQYSRGKASETEIDELLDWVKEAEDDTLLQEHIKGLWLQYRPSGNPQGVPDWDKMREAILGAPVIAIGRRERKGCMLWMGIAVAVVAVVVAAWLVMMGETGDGKRERVVQRPVVEDVAPGGDKAVLELADGRKIVLDDAENGNITQQGDVKVVKLDGQLRYEGSSDDGRQTSDVVYNTVRTPRGGKYQLILADGSRVWLNAESSLRFPTAFVGDVRMVEMSGEGYFEVKPPGPKGEKVPFIVKVDGGAEVEVLGTHFNINSYRDEGVVRATLLEGKVRVSVSNSKVKNQNSKVLRPGEQARVESGRGIPNDIRVIRDIDVEQVVAWKNGYFSFRNAGIREVMRQLEKWYDVEVVYEGGGRSPSAQDDKRFTGEIGRGLTLKEVLEGMDLVGVKYRIEGRRLIVQI